MSGRKALLLTNGGHINLPGNRELIEDIFIRQAGLDVEVSHDPTELTRERLGAADVLLDYSGDPKVLATDDQLAAVMATVEAGKPYLGLHAASLPFRAQMTYIRENDGAWPTQPAPNEHLNATQIQYLTMLGSAFLTHPPVRPFGVHVVDRHHPVTRGIDDFEIEDELYEIVGDMTGLHLLVEGEGERPLGYVKTHGQGTIVYMALGHGSTALANPHLQRMYVQAAHWLLQGAP
jgi:type 1 glutamine amidotransferase